MFVGGLVGIEAVYTLWDEGGLGEVRDRFAESRVGGERFAARALQDFRRVPGPDGLHESAVSAMPNDKRNRYTSVTGNIGGTLIKACNHLILLTPRVGIEPTTNGLTVR
jgi:hypothetical protein